LRKSAPEGPELAGSGDTSCRLPIRTGKSWDRASSGTGTLLLGLGSHRTDRARAKIRARGRTRSAAPASSERKLSRRQTRSSAPDFGSSALSSSWHINMDGKRCSRRQPSAQRRDDEVRALLWWASSLLVQRPGREHSRRASGSPAKDLREHGNPQRLPALAERDPISARSTAAAQTSN
jgi:hypothetical protein